MLWPFSNIVEKSWIADAGLRAGVGGASPLPAALVGRSLAKHSPRVLDPHFIAMLVCDSRTLIEAGAVVTNSICSRHGRDSPC